MNSKYARLWLGVFLVLVFAAGLAAGALLARRIGVFDGPGRFGFPAGRRVFVFGGPPAERLVMRLSRDLDLTEVQRTALEKVLAERRARLEKFHETVRADFEREQRELREAIRNILTDEQRARFDEVFPADRLMRRGPPRRRF